MCVPSNGTMQGPHQADTNVGSMYHIYCPTTSLRLNVFITLSLVQVRKGSIKLLG